MLKVSFNEPSCFIKFAKSASLSLVSEKFILLSFFDIIDFKYIFTLPHTPVNQVLFNINQVIFNNIPGGPKNTPIKLKLSYCLEKL